MEEYNEREMARMSKLIIFCVALMMILSMPTAMAAITVDGYKQSGEWNDDWAFAQDNASTYSANGPFGDRLVIRQGLYEGMYATNQWYDTDPKNDSGPDFDESMATHGESSGLDISRIYAHYDPINDTVYGLTEVYGIPGDADGNGDIGTVSPYDTNGIAGPTGIGLGSNELWYLRLSQDGTATGIMLKNNDWEISENGLTYDDIDARFTSNQTNSVYEISLKNIKQHYSVAPGAVLVMEITAGTAGDVPGEDTATVFIKIPNPEIKIVKTTSDGQGGWSDGPMLNMSDPVTWKYVVTNTGDVPLTNIVVTDDKEGNITLPQTTLEPSESMTVLVSSTATAYGQYSNIADVVGDFIGIQVVDEDPSHYYVYEPKPAIDIEKHTNGVDADYPKGPYLNLNDTVTWTYIVTNTGDVTLSNIVVIDDKIGAITLPVTTLASGASTTGTATGTVTDYGQYENQATVTGNYNTIEVTDMDPSHYYCAIDVPALTPTGLLSLIGLLGMIGIFGVKRRD